MPRCKRPANCEPLPCSPPPGKDATRQRQLAEFLPVVAAVAGTSASSSLASSAPLVLPTVPKLPVSLLQLLTLPPPLPPPAHSQPAEDATLAHQEPPSQIDSAIAVPEVVGAPSEQPPGSCAQATLIGMADAPPVLGPQPTATLEQVGADGNGEATDTALDETATLQRMQRELVADDAAGLCADDQGGHGHGGHGNFVWR